MEETAPNLQPQKDSQPKLSDYKGRILLFCLVLVLIGIGFIAFAKLVTGVIILLIGAVFGLGNQVANNTRL